MKGDTGSPQGPTELSYGAIRFMKLVSGSLADEFVEYSLVRPMAKHLHLSSHDEAGIRAHMEDPLGCLQVLFQHYLFARRGKDRTEMSELAVRALQSALSRFGSGLLTKPSGQLVWDEFEEECARRSRKPAEIQNRGPIQGMVELAQEVYQTNPGTSIAGSIVSEVENSGRIQESFSRIQDIRGLGPKCTATMFRDIAHIFDLERQIDPSDRLLLHPVDRWIRLATHYIAPEETEGDPPDWVIAGKLSKFVRRAKVSGVRCNMGIINFGQRTVVEPERFQEFAVRLTAEG